MYDFYARATVRTVHRRFVFGLSVRPCVRDHSLTRYLLNRLREFHKIYNFGAVGNTDETFRC